VISRQWKGIARAGEEERYIRHLQESTFPRAREDGGFRGASVYRGTVDRGTEFLVVTDWESEEAIRQFAGRTRAARRSCPEVQAVMVTYDREASHYEVAFRAG
jgi:heme-degrading monooxygenase HmoA